MLLLDITVVNVALPDIANELNTSFTDLQWVVDAYALTLAATMLNAGSLGDLLGRKRVFLVAIALFTVASALCGAAQSPTWLIVARGLQGIGGAGMFAVSLAIISQEFHGRERDAEVEGRRRFRDAALLVREGDRSRRRRTAIHGPFLRTLH